MLDLSRASALVREHGVKGAAQRLGISRHALKRAFKKAGIGTPSGRVVSESSRAQHSTPSVDDSGDIDRLIAVSRKGPLNIYELCDQLDMSPKRLRSLVAEAQSRGLAVKLERDTVGVRVEEQDERIRTVGVAPVAGKRQKVAVISDTHLGSKYCLRSQLKEFVGYAYEQGVREILHPGDWLDGMYRHGVWELTHSGLQAQTEDLHETLPRMKGLSYRGITGNHDHTFTLGAGMDTGRYIESLFRDRGRDDVHFYGNRGAFLRVAGAVVHLWHPRGGGAYAKSYILQKQVEKYASGEKPQVLLTGHHHSYCHIYERGIHALLCPTFQGGGSEFSKSLGGAPAIGGLILSWDLTEHGTMRSFSHEYRAYFERERPHQIEDHEQYREEIPVSK